MHIFMYNFIKISQLDQNLKQGIIQTHMRHSGDLIRQLLFVHNKKSRLQYSVFHFCLQFSSTHFLLRYLSSYARVTLEMRAERM